MASICGSTVLGAAHFARTSKRHFDAMRRLFWSRYSEDSKEQSDNLIGCRLRQLKVETADPFALCVGGAQHIHHPASADVTMNNWNAMCYYTETWTDVPEEKKHF
jgi:hypothetical protein